MQTEKHYSYLLTYFQRKKQQIINQIDTLVILKMDQLQYFRNQTEFNDIEKTLLFKNSVIKMLYDRVGQLEVEALEVQREHRSVYKKSFISSLALVLMQR